MFTMIFESHLGRKFARKKNSSLFGARRDARHPARRKIKNPIHSYFVLYA